MLVKHLSINIQRFLTSKLSCQHFCIKSSLLNHNYLVSFGVGEFKQAHTYSLWMHFEKKMLKALHHHAKGFNSIAENDFYDFVLHNMKLQALYALTKEPILLP